MLTLGNLIKLSDHRILSTLSKYRLDAFDTKTGNDTFGDYIRFLAEIVGEKHTRRSNLSIYDSSISLEAPSLVYCSCDYFKYNLEIALVAQGSAIQLHADALAPKIRNASMKPGLCPHLLLLAKVALNQGKIDAQKQDTAKRVAPRINPKLLK